MKSTLFLIVFCFGFLVSRAQDNVQFFRVDNVYGRDIKTILHYATEFIQANPELFSNTQGDTILPDVGKVAAGDGELVVSSAFLMKRPTTFCFGNILFTGDIAFMAKDARTRVEFRNIKYYIIPPGGRSACKGSGDYPTLKASKCCEGMSYVQAFLHEQFNRITTKYKSLLVSKRNDGAW